MDFIQQAHKGKLGYWKYLVFAFLFFGLSLSDGGNATQKINDLIEQFGKNITFFILLFPFVLLLGFLFLWVNLVHKQPIKTLTTSRKKIDWKRVFFSFFVWGSITTLMILASYLFSPEDVKLNFQLEPFLYLLVIAVLLVPIQTSFEEYFFRGYLMQGIGAKFKSRLLALVITSVTFGLMHYGNPEVAKLGSLIMVYYIGTGFFLGIITLMDEGLELALGFHSANNLITALLITSDWSAFQTNSIFKDFSEPELVFSAFIPVFVFYPLLLFIFSKKYNWTNWKEHLI